MRIPDVCRFTSLSRSTLYLLISRSEVEIVKIGAGTHVLTESLRALMKESEVGNARVGLVRHLQELRKRHVRYHVAALSGKDDWAITLPKLGAPLGDLRGPVAQRHDVFAFDLHPLLGNRPESGIEVDLTPGGAADLPRPGCRQDRKFEGKTAECFLFA